MTFTVHYQMPWSFHAPISEVLKIFVVTFANQYQIAAYATLIYCLFIILLRIPEPEESKLIITSRPSGSKYYTFATTKKKK